MTRMMSLTHTLSLIQVILLLMRPYLILGTLTHFDSSTNILKVRILELEKIINIYQTNMGELKRMKLELSKCKDENPILNV
jgi:hypothetical protein